MAQTQIKVWQVWGDCDPRPPNRYLLVESVTDTRVTLRNLRTGRVSAVRRDRMKPGRKGYFLARDPEVMAEVSKQLAEAKNRERARFLGHHYTAPMANGFQARRVNGMRSWRCKRQRRTNGDIGTVNEIESLVDCGDRWKDLNRCTMELSTYSFGGIPGFTGKL